jgi:hypothetical protein
MTERTCAEARDTLNAIRANVSEISARLGHPDAGDTSQLETSLDALRREEAFIVSWMTDHNCDEVKMPTATASNLNEITIRDLAGVKNIPKFTAPEERLAARALWVFLVESLPVGFVVELQIPQEGLQLAMETGSPLPEDQYRRIMRGAAEGDETVS